MERQESSTVGDKMRSVLLSVLYLIRDCDSITLPEKKSGMQCIRGGRAVLGLFKNLMHVVGHARRGC